MTWKQLAEHIAAMPPPEREQPARFVEPYDKDKAGYFVEFVIAYEDILVGEGRGDEVFVAAGEWMLR